MSLCNMLGAFAKLRKTTVSFAMSIRPHGTTLLPLDNLVFESFSKIRGENSSFAKTGQG